MLTKILSFSKEELSPQTDGEILIEKCLAGQLHISGGRSSSFRWYHQFSGGRISTSLTSQRRGARLASDGLISPSWMMFCGPSSRCWSLWFWSPCSAASSFSVVALYDSLCLQLWKLFLSFLYKFIRNIGNFFFCKLNKSQMSWMNWVCLFEVQILSVF